MLSRQNLRKRLTDPIEAFYGIGDVTHTPDGPMVFQDNGAKILAVAHLDYVGWTARPTIRKGIVRAAQLDDRLGAWVLLDILPALGVKCDILLTDSEEVGRSTARHFNDDGRYNWAFEFDRTGEDAVLYDWESEEMVSLLKSYGYKVGLGSFSDICALMFPGINFGTGYYNQHTKGCYADLRVTERSVGRFLRFYQDHAGHKLDEWFPDDDTDEWGHKTGEWDGDPWWKEERESFGYHPEERDENDRCVEDYLDDKYWLDYCGIN